MRRRILSILMPGLLCSAAAATDYVFDGGPDGTGQAWDIAENWSPDGVPGAGDTATIGAGGPPSTTFSVAVSSSIDVDELHVLGGSNFEFFNGSTITVSGASSFFGDLLAGDDAFVDIEGDGTIILNGAGLFRAVSMFDTTSLVVNDSLTASTGEAWAVFSGGADTSVMINGALALGGADSGNNTFTSGAITVSPSGSVTITSDGWNLETPGSPDGVNNSGTITVNCDPSATADILDLGVSDGALDVLSGTMRLVQVSTSVGEVSGSVTVASGATLTCKNGTADNLVLSGTLAGDGRLLIEGDVLFVDLAATIALVEMGDDPARRLSLSGDSTLSGDLFANSGIDGSGSLTVGGMTHFVASADISPDVSVIMNGPSTIESVQLRTDGQLTINADALMTGDISDGGSQGGALTIAPGVILTMQGAVELVVGAGSENLGTIVKTGAGEAEWIPGYITNGGLANHGLIQVLEGTLLDATTSTHTGDVEIAAGARYEVTFGTYTADSEWTGEGTVEIRNNSTNCCWVTHDGTIDVAFGELRDRLNGSGNHMFATAVIGGLEQGGSCTVTVDEMTMDWHCLMRENAVFRVAGTATIDFNFAVYQDARLEIAGWADWIDSTFVASGANGEITILPGGTLNCTADEDCQVPFNNQGTIVMNSAGTTRFINSNASINNGLFEVASGTTQFWQGAPTQGDDGITRLSGGTLLHPNGDTLTYGSGRVEGVSLHDDTLHSVEATVAPGLSPGELPVNGDFTQGECATLEIELGGYEQGVTYDHLNVTGVAMLDGILSIEYVDGFSPTAGDTFTIITSADASGVFNQIVGPGSYGVTLVDGQVVVQVLSAECVADVDNNASVDVMDLIELLAQWGACPKTGPACELLCTVDFDETGSVDVFDLLLLLSLWGPCS